MPCRKPCEDLEMWEKFATFVAEFKNMVMGEEVIPFFNEVKDTMQGIIKVVGVGGGGCNAVRNMYNEGVAGVTYAACNTDSQSLKGSPVPVKVLMGEGLGAGGDPEIGRSEAEKSIDSLRDVLSDGTKMVFITASMGGLCARGGTGGQGTRTVDGGCGDDPLLFRKEAEDHTGAEGCRRDEEVCRRDAYNQ